MTDPDDTRAEQAFRDAFAQRADDVEPVTLATPERSRWSRWLVLGAAAAVLAVVAGSVALGTWAPDRPDPADRVDQPAEVLPPAEPGWRWATWRDVGVQVPETWIDGVEPGRDWCARSSSQRPVPETPEHYVSKGASRYTTLDIGCGRQERGRPAVFGDAPMEMWRPHLTLDDVPEELLPGDTRYRGWTMHARTVGGVKVRVLADTASADVAETVLGSIRTFDVDPSGCEARSAAQAVEVVRPEDPFDVGAVNGIDAISICQYSRGGDEDWAGLVASRRLEGGPAADLLRAIQTAPAGGGPDRPDRCSDTGPTVIVARVHHDDRTDDLYMYSDSCRGNGYDDGTTRRALTANNCAPVFDEEVRLLSWPEFVGIGSRCARPYPVTGDP